MADELVALRDRREQVIAQLSDAFAKDTLDVDEFERRLGLAHRADAIVELEPLVVDLPAPPKADPKTQTALVPLPAHTKTAPPSRVREKQTLVAVMGGTSRKGTWTPARKLDLFTIMGGAEIDFRDAVFAEGVTEVRIFAVMGGAHIIVPPSLAVEMEGIAVMGGFDTSERAPAADHLDPERPLLRVSGFAFMGGVHIETRLPGESQWQASKRRRREKKLMREKQRELEKQAKQKVLAPHDE